MSGFHRHLMKGAAADPDARFLRYWWCGGDAPVMTSNKTFWWYDRLAKKGFGADRSFYSGGSYSVSAGNYLMMYSILNFGRHFRIVFDASCKVQTDNYVQQVVFMDVNSLTNSNKGFLCSLYQHSGCPSMNYKMFGNDNAAPYKFPVSSFPFETGDTLDGRFEFGNEEYDDTHDILWFRFNGREKIYSLNPHAIVSHDGIGSTSTSLIRLNGGVIGSTYSGTRYSQDMTYRDIKVYVYD